MRDDLTDFDGTPEEFRHLAEAMQGVRAWMKSDSGWGKAEPIIDPAPQMSTEPGIEKEHKEVTPSPSSNVRRYQPALGVSYGLNSKGRKSHRKGKNATPKMLDGTSGTHLAVAIPPIADISDGNHQHPDV